MSIASSRLPIRSVVVAETWLAAALFAYVLGPGMWSIVGAIIGVVAAGTTLIRGLRGTRSGSVTLPRRRLFGRAAGAASPEFPLPVDVTVDDGRVGVRCAGTTLISVVRVAEIQPVPVAVTTHPPPVASLPLAVLADCLEQFDIRLDGIDVVHVAGRDWSTDRVGLTCARTLGPLAVTTHTARPAIWEPLMRAVGDPRRLSPAPGHPPPPHAVPVHLYDDVPAPAEPHPGITTIRVTVADRASQDVTVAPDPPVIARIVQDADRDSMLLTTAAGSQRLTLVATPDEWQLIGRSVPASAELSRPRS